MDRYKLVSEKTEIFSLEVPRRLEHTANTAVKVINNLMKDYKLEPAFSVDLFNAMFKERVCIIHTEYSMDSERLADRVILTFYKQTTSIKEIK